MSGKLMEVFVSLDKAKKKLPGEADVINMLKSE